MIKIKIDNKEVSEVGGTTIIQACKNAGIDIPRFCYHERLSIAGNCRMCLVEIANSKGERSPKPVASCAMPIQEGMCIYTNTPLVKKAQEGVMEFLLLNHPLDCPICDQGGECDLQDQAMAFGNDRGRFYDYKRAVEDKNAGILIKTIMTRCIHCTRCIRFASEVAGVPIWGTSGRGSDTEVGMYIEKTFESEISGNIIDLCPVGALTSKPYAFTARPWELQSTESIDILDSIGSNIRIDSRGHQIMRIIPRLNESINEEWITDKIRFSYDGLKKQRLNLPMIRDERTDQLVATDWKNAFNYIKQKMKSFNRHEIGAIVGPLVDAETIVCLKDLMNRIGSCNISCFEQENLLSADIRSNYLLNTQINGLEETDVCLLIGTNLRKEAPLLNTRLRKSVLNNNTIVASIGHPINLTYDVEHLGNSFNIFLEILNKKHPFYRLLKNAKKPMILIGSNCFNLYNNNNLLPDIYALCKDIQIMKGDWNGLGIIHSLASITAAMDIGFVPGKNSRLDYSEYNYGMKMLYLVGADHHNLKRRNDNLIIYQGHHGDYSANEAHVILPGSAFTEKNALYVNIEGRVQQTKIVFQSPGNSREDWKIIKALSEILGKTLPYQNLMDVRKRLSEISPSFNCINQVQRPTITQQLYELSNNSLESKITNYAITSPFKDNLINYYMTDSICRASSIMAKCTKPISNYH